MEFIGTIEEVVADRSKKEESTGTRLFVKMCAADSRNNTQSIYCRVQGRKAQTILEHMDEFCNVEGRWKAVINPQVMEYPGKQGYTIHANLLHCVELERVEEGGRVSSTAVADLRVMRLAPLRSLTSG